jgi:O-antigen ligase
MQIASKLTAGTTVLRLGELPRELTAAGVLGAGAVVFALAATEPLVTMALTMIAAALLALTKFPGVAVGVLAAAIFINLADIASSQYGLPYPGVFLVMGIMAVAFARALQKQEDLSAIIPLAVGAGVHLSWNAISLFWVIDAAPTVAALKELAKGWTIALVIFGLTRTPERFRTASRIIVIAVGTVAALACIQYLSGGFDRTFFGFANAQIKHIAGNLNSWRVSGPFPDPNYFAQTLVIALPLAATCAITDPKWSLRLISIVGGPLIMTAMLFTFSRGGLAGIGAIALAGVLLVRLRWTVIAALLLFVMTVVVVAPDTLLQRVTPVLQASQALLTGQEIEEHSLRQRVELTAVGLQMFRSEPILGLGVGQYNGLYPDFALRYGYDISAPPSAHNRFVEVLAEGGVIGLTIFLMLCITPIVVAYKAATALSAGGRASEAALVKAAIVGFIGYLVTSVFLHDAFPRFFWVQVGLLMSTWWYRPSGTAAISEASAHG